MNKILLDRNENQYGPAPACYDVLQRANLEELSLYSREYTRGRKSELSERLSTLFGIPEDRVLLSYGSEDMLKQSVHCYLHAGQTLLLPATSWWYYKVLAGEKAGSTVEYDVHEQEGEFVSHVDDIMQLYDRHHPAVILIASPNNPTGSTISPDDLERVAGHCSSSVIILDEAYHGFTEEPHDHLHRLVETHHRLVILRTFSKYYALAGLRIGYACVGKDLHHLITYTSRYLGYNRLSEKLALAALDNRTYYESIAKRMTEDKQTLYREFSSLEGFTPFRSDANFMLVRYPRLIKKELRAGLGDRNIVVKFLEDPGLEDYMRITIGTREQNARVIAAVREIAEEQVAAPVRMGY
jgi:histidinol-phosphate aminotransferase